MKSEVEIEAYVLAGGKSSRMGKDKGLVLFNGQPMISYVLKALAETGISVKIIANNEGYEKFGHPVVADLVEEKGPMGGLFTAFSYTNSKAVLLMSCDMPLVTSEAIKQLLDKAEINLIIAPTEEGRVNPLFALYPLSLKQEIERRITNGRLKMTDLILENKHTLVPSIVRENPGIFRNVNNEEELKMTEKQWNNLK
ncbi:molybdenum cofactor guanylyltransferase [Gillisia sp. Q332]|uniref:molybdenum cofactor guanylyltransferase n=1 Tax=Gillisia xinjiangensis TaxID=3384765 RepID=UPI00391CA6D1